MASNSPKDSHSRRIVDESLLSMCMQGDRSAQRNLYTICHPQVSRIATKMVGRQDAGDVVQQTFMRLFQKLETYAGESKFETWLYRLAVNEALQHLRRRSRREFQSLVVEPMSRNMSIEESRIDREFIDTAIQRLAPELRAVLALKEIESKSYEEIAEIVGIPVGTVGSRLNRARRELRQHLLELGWEP